MGRFQLLAATLAMGFASAVVEAGPPVRIGIGFGFGVPYYRPYYPYSYGYPYGYPYVVPAPVIYQSPPLVVQSGPVVGTTPAPSYSSPNFAAPEANQLHPANPNAQANLDFHLARLSSPDEALRRESVMELGRSKNERALDPLAAASRTEALRSPAPWGSLARLVLSLPSSKRHRLITTATSATAPSSPSKSFAATYSATDRSKSEIRMSKSETNSNTK